MYVCNGKRKGNKKELLFEYRNVPSGDVSNCSRVPSQTHELSDASDNRAGRDVTGEPEHLELFKKNIQSILCHLLHALLSIKNSQCVTAIVSVERLDSQRDLEEINFARLSK